MQGLAALPSRVQNIIDDIDNDLLFSAVSVTEIALKTSIGKLSVREGDVLQGVEDLQLTLIPYEPKHARRLFGLPLHHREPFDRMLIATALVEDLPIIAGDREFRKYRGLEVIW